jgi:hypothetical protein
VDNDLSAFRIMAVAELDPGTRTTTRIINIEAWDCSITRYSRETIWTVAFTVSRLFAQGVRRGLKKGGYVGWRIRKIGASLGRFKHRLPEAIPESPAPEATPKGFAAITQLLAEGFIRPPPEAIPAGFVPITQFLAEDIFVVGYPRSGNTWFQNLVAGTVYGVDPRWAPSALAHDLVPDLAYNKYYRRYATPMFFKSHDLPRPEFRRVVYLLRDGRDVMVSYRQYREAIDGVDYDFLKFVSPESQLYPCHWAEHVAAWTQNPYRAQILVIKYEDLLREPERELGRFCQFIGISRETGHLTAIAKAASFANLRDGEARMGFGRPDHNLPPGTFFFRRGVVGSHKDEMPPEVLERFLEHAGDTLRRCGYATGELGEKTAG